MAWSWKSSPELMQRLMAAQNHPKNDNIDIVTFAGWCETEEALRIHVERYEQKAAAVAEVA